MLRHLCLLTPAVVALLCVSPSVNAQGFYTSGIWGLPLGGYRYATPGYGGYGYSTAVFREPRHVGYALAAPGGYALAAPGYGVATYGTAYYGSGYTAGYGAGCYGSYGASCYGSGYSSGACYGSGYGAGCLGRYGTGYGYADLPPTRTLLGYNDDAYRQSVSRLNATLDRIEARLTTTRAPMPKQKDAVTPPPPVPQVFAPGDRDLVARARWWDEVAAASQKSASDAPAPQKRLPKSPEPTQ